MLPGIKDSERRSESQRASVAVSRSGLEFIADGVWGRKPPFDPISVAKDLAAMPKSYRCAKIVGDAYAGEWVARAEYFIEQHQRRGCGRLPPLESARAAA